MVERPTSIFSMICRDGIVMAGVRGAESFRFINREIVFSAAGHRGVIQRAAREIERIHTNQAFVNLMGVNLLIGKLQAALRSILIPDRDASAGDQTAAAEALIVMEFEGELRLMKFDSAAVCTEATELHPYAYLGPSTSEMECLGAFFLECVWEERLPTMQEATGAAAWIMSRLPAGGTPQVLQIQPAEDAPLEPVDCESAEIQKKISEWNSHFKVSKRSTNGRS